MSDTWSWEDSLWHYLLGRCSRSLPTECIGLVRLAIKEGYQKAGKLNAACINRLNI